MKENVTIEARFYEGENSLFGAGGRFLGACVKTFKNESGLFSAGALSEWAFYALYKEAKIESNGSAVLCCFNVLDEPPARYFQFYKLDDRKKEIEE